jgi:uncharacterized protein (DUF885 family)
MRKTFDSVVQAGDAYLRAYADMYPRERAAYGFFPFGAAYMGLHEGDGRVTDYSPDNVARRLADLDHWRATLDAVAPLALSDDDRQDLATLRWVHGAETFALRGLQPHRRKPLHYNDTIDVSGYIRRNYAPLDERLSGLLNHLRVIPDALGTAIANLDGSEPISRIDLRQARQSFRGHIAFMQKDLLEAVVASSDRQLVGQIEGAAETAINAIADLVDHLGTLEANAVDAVAIGSDRFLSLLREFEMVDLPLDTLRAAGGADLERNKAQLVEVCRQIDPAASTREVSDRLREDHPAAGDLLDATRAVLDSLRGFTRERELVSMPSPIDAVVAETPAFHRWSFASMDSPGAFEDAASGAHYYITSPELDWTSAQQDQWMRRFFYASIVNTSAHEAYPGHYVQSMHKRLAPTSVQKAFDSFTHWEAWAHYVEQMVLDEGYAPDDPAQRVAQLQAALLRDARYVVAIGLHCDGMTVDDATRIIMDATLMDELPARREAERGTFDPGYGSYTLGKLMLLKLRDDAKREQGEAFNLGAFHNAFLAHGAPPFPIVRARMLTQDDGALL